MGSKRKCVVIYTEGETDYEFYDLVLEKLKEKYNISKFSADKIIKQCLKGITKFDKKLLRKFEYEIVPKYKNYEIIVFLCYDTDVFEDSPNPPVKWSEVEEKLKKLKATKVFHIKAEKCIEDFFLLDLSGICQYLEIDEVKNITGENGVEKLKKLFARGDRIYQKGFSCEGFIKSLDINLILNEIEDIIEPLIDELVKVK